MPDGSVAAYFLEKLKRLFWPLVKRVDSTMQRLVLVKPTPRVAQFWLGVVALLLGAAFFTRLHLGGQVTVDLFLTPILIACIVFKLRGLLVLLPACLLYAWAGYLCHDVPTRYVAINALGQLLEWSVLSLFVLVTLNKYSTVKKLQEKTEVDLALARKLQCALIPPNFQVGSVRVEGFVNQTQDLGGDFYYLRPFQQKYVVFCLGDVMGKGIAASLVMAIIMGFMFEWGKKYTSPAAVLAILNRQLCKLSEGSQADAPFVTLFYAIYDEESQILTYSLAGHQAGILMRPDGTTAQLTGEGIPAGIFSDFIYTENSIQLGVGDRVAVFTDGISEARDESGTMFGPEGIAEIMKSERFQPIGRVLEVLKQRVGLHSKGQKSDDMAALIFETTRIS